MKINIKSISYHRCLKIGLILSVIFIISQVIPAFQRSNVHAFQFSQQQSDNLSLVEFLQPEYLDSLFNEYFVEKNSEIIIDRNPFVEVVEQALPAVVNIRIEKIVTVPYWDPFNFDPFHSPFHQPSPQYEQRAVRGEGTGFIISSDGYIITNNHIVGESNRITVTISNGTVYDADQVELVGTDPLTDIAVLKIETEQELPYLKLGNSDFLKPGQWAIAIGNPYGLDHTVTVGVISATGRSQIAIPEGPSYQDFIQTDASINPGNSGGPLIDITGNVIGVNSIITSPTGGSVGIGFAIPVNLALSIADQLIGEGKVVRSYIGIYIEELTGDLKIAMNAQDLPGGIIVADIIEDSPADKSQLLPGDIIVEVDNDPVENVNEFRLDISNRSPGSSVQLTIWRTGEKKYIDVVLEEMVQKQEVTQNNSTTGPWLGLDVEELTPYQIQRLNLDISGGVFVKNLVAGMSGERAGLSVGDIIVKIGEVEIYGNKDFQKARSMYKTQHEPLLFQFIRNGRNYFIAVKPD
ncbi:MAG: Do family serine endopeptidase [bacterium]